jgi:signal transduction histidine kinase
VGLAAYIFSVSTFKPVNDLVTQAESVKGHDLNFRLTYANPNDEIGKVASSFNKVLDRVQRLVESQKSFISYASHELRTPLAAINGILETSLNYDTMEESVRESLMAARKEIQKATNLVSGLLQLAKIDSVRAELEFSKLNVVDVLLDAISFYKLKKAEQEFLFDITETGENVSIEVKGHAQLLRTAFINLIDNASKYSQMQKIEIKLKIVSKEKIRIEIIDKGIGIDQSKSSQLFDPFFRGSNSTGFEGFGLGLSLTKRIFLLHASDVLLDQNQYSGVTASVLLPAVISTNA